MANPAQVVFRPGVQATLPYELVESLNQVYFLHLLATEPERVIPPGKTLLSMMIHSRMNTEKNKGDQAGNLLERVQEVAHRAFWNEAVEALSSSDPSIQLPRLKRLYHDLAEALTPLFPRDHIVIQTLEAHFPPTTSPLHYALSFLKELLSELRKRCAPIRDEAIDSLLASLDAWRDPIPDIKAGPPVDASNSSPLAVLIVNTIREVVGLADQMKSDLNAAVIGAMGEDEVRVFVLREAKARERELVLELWKAKQSTPEHHLREEWQSWVSFFPQSAEGIPGEVPSEKLWVVRLMHQLAANHPVACSFPAAIAQNEEIPAGAQNELRTNVLPPHFLFVVPKLVYIQNYLQAITIAASLRSLTRLPIANGSGHDFMTRVWTLLKGEINDATEGKEDELGSVKLINLSDEVVRARRLASVGGQPELGQEEEARLRAAVERTLKPDDPVFVLLQRRLIDALTKGLLESLSGDGNRNSTATIPQTMRTGRALGDTRPGKRPRLAFPDHAPHASLTNGIHLDRATAPVTAKGFEDPVLVHAVEGVYRDLIRCITWVEAVWGDLVW
ncbi:hypothetical protein NMY22_g9248 [Coprinellus aureogranulatus]|nr:hypothetical protein NMY22_g9248 [Coprinellus aureogranulatus]